MQQRTVKQSCILCGVGVHSGVPSRVIIHSAPIDHGIVWQHSISRHIFKMGDAVPAVAPHATVFATQGARVSTIEHIMAALWQQGITNARCVLEGDEAPILDGSSIAIIWALEAVGVVEQDAPVQYLRPTKPVVLTDAQRDGLIRVEPHESDALYLSYETQSFSWSGELTPDIFREQFAAARTCGDIAQLPMLRQHGLAQGSTTGNTIALQNGDFFNTPRVPDEPQRHKVLDLIGDLYLLGAPLAARITARNTGHSFNREVIVRQSLFSL